MPRSIYLPFLLIELWHAEFISLLRHSRPYSSSLTAPSSIAWVPSLYICPLSCFSARSCDLAVTSKVFQKRSILQFGICEKIFKTTESCKVVGSHSPAPSRTAQFCPLPERASVGRYIRLTVSSIHSYALVSSNEITREVSTLSRFPSGFMKRNPQGESTYLIPFLDLRTKQL